MGITRRSVVELQRTPVAEERRHRRHWRSVCSAGWHNRSRCRHRHVQRKQPWAGRCGKRDGLRIPHGNPRTTSRRMADVERASAQHHRPAHRAGHHRITNAGHDERHVRRFVRNGRRRQRRPAPQRRDESRRSWHPAILVPDDRHGFFERPGPVLQRTGRQSRASDGRPARRFSSSRTNRIRWPDESAVGGHLRHVLWRRNHPGGCSDRFVADRWRRRQPGRAGSNRSTAVRNAGR